MLCPDIGHVYPKSGLDADIRFDTTPRFVSSGSMFLDGTDDFLNLDGLTWTSSGANYSFTCWVKSRTGSTDHKRVFGAKSSSASDRFNLYWDSGVTLKSYTEDGTTNTFTIGAVGLTNTWHHFALTVGSGTAAKFYLDGQLIATDTQPDMDFSSCDDFVIGAAYDGNTSTSFDGNICHFGVWHDELSQAEIRELMTATTYAEVVSKGGSTPRAYFLLESNATDSVGAITYTTSSSTSGTLTNGAVIVGDRARLPNGFDLTGNLDARCFSGRAVAFDGAADYLMNSHPISIDASGETATLACWFKATSNPGAGSYRTILSNHSASNDLMSIYQGPGNKVYCLALHAAGTYVEHEFAGVQLGTWHFAVATWAKDSTDLKFYVDGLESTAAPGSAIGPGQTAGKIEIGARYNSASPVLQLFVGSIADCKIFDVVLTAAQALELYQNPELPVPTGVSSTDLIHHFPLCDYDIIGADNLDELYLQNLAQPNKPILAYECGMEFGQPSIPQLGLRSSSSRVLFDGTNDYVNLGHPAISQVASGDFSIACWAFPTGSALGFILSKTDGSGASYRGYRIGFTADGYSRLRISDGTTEIEVSGSTDLRGGWHHFAATIDRSGNAVVYIDGSAESTTDITGVNNAIEPSTNLVLGTGFGGSPAYYLSGIIDQAAIYKGTVLDAPAVAAMHAGGRGFDLLTDSGNYDYASDLDGWWCVENPVTIQDLSTNSNTGTVSGTPAMATVPEGTTADLSAFGTLTNNRPSFAWSGGAGINAYNDFSGNIFSLPDPGFGTANYTVAFWYRCTAYPGDNASLVFTKSTDGSRFFDIFFQSNTATRFTIQGSGGAGQKVDTSVTVTAAQQIGSWIQIVLRREAAATHSFVIHPLDASAVSTTDETSKTPADIDSDSAYGFRFGGGYDETHEYGSPSYAQFAFPRIWVGEAITDAQVDALYESGARMLRGT